MHKIIKGKARTALLANDISNLTNQRLQSQVSLDNPSKQGISTILGLNNTSLGKLSQPEVQSPDAGILGTNLTDKIKTSMSDGSLQKALNASVNESSNLGSGGLDMTSMLSSGGLDAGIDAISNATLGLLGKNKSELSGTLDQIGNVAGMIPTYGTAIKYGLKAIGLANDIGSKTFKPISINSGISGYSGSDMNYAGKTIGGISRLFGGEKKEKKKINEMKKDAVAAKVNVQPQLTHLTASNQSISNTATTNQNKLNGGSDFRSLMARSGGRISKIIKFKNGGAMNVIPSGSLHARKNNLDEVNTEISEKVTNKGIPVVQGGYVESKDGHTLDLEKGGDIIQTAEIEKDEVILHKALTVKLEELMKLGTDEAAIEAGKLLSKELIENTIDNTGLTEKTIGNEN